MKPEPVTIVWFRRDLRLTDNPALAAAVDAGGAVVPLFILDEDSPGAWAPGGASRWWLHESLAALRQALGEQGLELVLRRGVPAAILDDLARETGARAVHWNRCYEPYAIARDKAVKAGLADRGLEVRSFAASLLREPWTVITRSGGPYKVFTPFWKALRDQGDPDAPLPAPTHAKPGAPARTDDLDAWGLLPHGPDWAGGLRDTWSPGEAGAQERLADFLERAVTAYPDDRNRPDRPGTSRLSPHLAWGEISPRQIWHRVRDRLRAAGDGAAERGCWSFLRELGWRDFSYHLLYHWPDFPERTWQPGFAAFPWRDDEAGYRAWCRGRTGYPAVDAAMRELWHSGWMHNRMRMVAASFLVKHLLIPWQRGEAWFWDTLADADLANNSASWQWVAGCGADAAPYFRIFNPVAQGETHDPDGAYVRRWVPELARLPGKYLNKPWEAPPEILRDSDVKLGETYPKPLVDHKMARDRALGAYAEIKKG